MTMTALLLYCCWAGSSNVKRRKTLALKYKLEWKQRFLMWPVCSYSRSGEVADDEMICVLCNERMKAKCSTANRHQERKHPQSKTYSEGKRSRILAHYKASILKQQATMKHSMEPNQLLKSLTNTKCHLILLPHAHLLSLPPWLIQIRLFSLTCLQVEKPSSRETVTRRT